MKLIFCLILVLGLAGCSTYTTRQTDISEGRTITTDVSVRTFWDSSSQLGNSATVQTDKSQSAKIGTLNQTSTSTNITQQLEVLLKLAELLGTKGLKP